jgi:putative transposase
VTQRGNGRQAVFFEDGDYALYRDLLELAARQARVEIWSYCLMPNHVGITVTVHLFPFNLTVRSCLLGIA